MLFSGRRRRRRLAVPSQSSHDQPVWKSSAVNLPWWPRLSWYFTVLTFIRIAGLVLSAVGTRAKTRWAVVGRMKPQAVYALNHFDRAS
jgi:hypothetical protein